MTRILVSACLVGRPVRYDGRAKTASHPALERWRAAGWLVPLCPEVAAGLPTPRPPAEIEPGTSAADVLAGRAAIRTVDGADVSAAFRDGARIALETALAHGCRHALLTDGSPSCGSGFVHDGRFNGHRIAGEGVVAATLRAHGILVFADSDIDRLAALLDEGSAAI